MYNSYEKNFAQRMKNNYPPGTRLELISMDDPYTGDKAEHFKNARHTIDFNKIIPQPENIGDDWYSWNTTHWGTKWNSYGYENGNPTYNSAIFDTAWDAPHPIIKKLSEMYPELTIEHAWASEDIGYNCGRNLYVGGKLIEEYFPDYCWPESVEFACEIIGTTPEEAGFLLTAGEDDYICAEDPYFQVVELLGQTALFSNNKLSTSRIPQGTYVYVFTYYNRIRVCSVNPGGLPPVKYREWVAVHAA